MKKFVITVNMMMEMCMCRMCMISCVLFSDESSISEAAHCAACSRAVHSAFRPGDPIGFPGFYFSRRCPT